MYNFYKLFLCGRYSQCTSFFVFLIFRHKEVFVYPDDSVKPSLGNGLNKKAQITLDRVWPIDKTLQTFTTSPKKLATMCYEEKLQKACIKMKARFVEYRSETGSWVFKVDHFSKYGLDDSDEEEPKKDHVVVDTAPKKFKTLQLRTPTATVQHQQQPNVEMIVPNVTVHAEDISHKKDSFEESQMMSRGRGSTVR